jgi:DnaK suppressor protein
MLGRNLRAKRIQVPQANYTRTLRSMLQALRDQEIRRLRRLVLSGIEQKAPMPGDRLDDARRHEEMDLQMSLIEMSERRLAAIFNAFERLEQGGYGICEACGDGISFERLRAMPTVQYCVDCQAELETAAHKRGAP